MARSMERLSVSETGYSLPATEVLTGRGFVTGKSGSGKSNTASVVAEELLERGLGLLIVDTDGEYHGLQERYEILHVGADESCDRVVEPGDGGVLADLALEDNVPIILDVSGFLDEETARAVIHDVIEALFVAEADHRKPFLLFVEEAHEFMPQQGGGDDLSKMLVRVAKRGRKRGLGICAMSQRPAAVDKDYITQCDWLVWHRLTWENDTEVAGRILGGDAETTVQSLDNGEALVLTDWDESLKRVQFRRKRTVDAGSTPDVLESYGPRTHRDDHRVDEESDDAKPEGPTLETEDTAPEPETEPTTDPTPEPSVDSPEPETDEPAEGEPQTAAARADRRRRAVESPERFDPLWELGHLLVYVYDSLVIGHVRLRRQLEGPVDGGLERVGRSNRRLTRLVSNLLLVGTYLAVVLIVGVALTA